ncbi:GNAT family N-acetyltransferase [Aquihabitans daechungensis]|uniref:GNAT family N-acetyltransferase n=1 Tax=Aquihabitans daechungensis TaxID=1052257 RepID=UPI003B9EC542
MVVRVATRADVDALPGIEAAAGERFRTIPALAFVADHDPSFAPEIVAAALDEGRLWVATVGRHVVGYALALDLDGQPHLEQISVLPEWSGHGVGRTLIDAVAAWAAGRSTSLTLATFRDVDWNAPLYAHLGWEPMTDAEVDADPRLVAVRDHEAEHGLDPADRVFMRRPV